MPTTARGISYPSSTGHTRIWEHIQDTANSVDTALNTLASITPFYVFKAATENLISSTSMQNDDELFVNLKAGKIYSVEAIVSVVGDPAADIKTQWTFSGTLANSTKNVIGPASSTTTPSDTSILMRPFGVTTAVTYGTSATAGWIRENLYLEVLTDGVLQFQWAQGTSTAVNTQVLSASRMIVSPLVIAT
jgi:hypothetical protein